MTHSFSCTWVRKRPLGTCHAILVSSLLIGLLTGSPAFSDVTSLSPDVTVTLDASDIADESVAIDDGSDSTVAASLGSLPEGAAITGYHLLANGDQLFSLDITAALPGGLVVYPSDVVRYNGVGYSLEFDSATEGIPASIMVDAVSQTAAGDLLLSFDTTVDLGGAVIASDEDLVQWDGANFSVVFDGSNNGIEGRLDLDAADASDAGSFHLSFDASGSVGGIHFDDEDILHFDPSGPTWTLAYDGSAEHSALAAADVEAVAVQVVGIPPDYDFEAEVNALLPGDELVLIGGTYSLSGHIDLTAVGTSEEPIIIRAKAGEQPILIGSAGQNVINISGQYLELRGLEFSGGGGHGIRLMSTADHITLSDCHIHDVPSVGIAANNSGAEYLGLEITGCEINNTGQEGLYLGCNDDVCRVNGAQIVRNYLHDLGYEGIDLKTGSANNLIKDNVIHASGMACIIVGSTLGNGPPNAVEANALWECGTDAIQITANVALRNNVVLGAAANAVHVRSYQGAIPDGVEILHNTLLNPSGGGFRVRGVSGGTVVIANNAIYTPEQKAIDNTGTAITTDGNAGEGATVGIASGWNGTGVLATDFVAANLSGATPNDVFPAFGSILIDTTSSEPTSNSVPDDFNGTPRAGFDDIGAYAYDPSGNPGWPLQADFKPMPVPEPGALWMLICALTTLGVLHGARTRRKTSRRE